MQLTPILLRIKDAASRQFVRFNWPEKKNRIHGFLNFIKQRLSRELLKQFFYKKVVHCFHDLKKKNPFLQKITWKSPKIKGVFVLITLIAGGSVWHFATTTSASAVLVNGRLIGLVQNASDGDMLLNTVLERQGQPYGLTAKTHDQITFKKLRLKSAAYRESVLHTVTLAENLSFYFEGYQIVIGGEVIAVLPAEEDAATVLKAYQDHYVKPSEQNRVISVGFAEELSIEAAEALPIQMKQADEVLQMLFDGRQIVKNYLVEQDDSWWLIARKNDMLTDEVLAGNPGNTKESILNTGQIVKLISSTPYLTVVSKGIYTGPETIPYDVVTKTDSSLNSDQTKILSAGVNGSKIVTYSYEQKNGLQVSKLVLDETITQAPVDEVVAKGTRQPTIVASATSRGSGDGSSSSIVSHALSLQGSSYVYGGTGGGGYDCSGFTKAVFAGNGIYLPRTSYSQFSSGTPVNKSDLVPGDLVFFSTYASGASHVGIYVGGGSFVHASTPDTGVITSSMGDGFYSSRYLGARRYN